MAFHIFTKLTIATAGAAVLTIRVLSAPASAAVLYSFTTVTGGTGAFNYQFTGGASVSHHTDTWGFITHFHYTPLASALANGSAFITRNLFNGTGEGRTEYTSVPGISFDGVYAKTAQQTGFPYWEVNLINTNTTDDKGKITFSQSSSNGGASEWEAIASWNRTEAIPEPTTIAGSLLGLGGLVATRRNRQMKSQDKLAA